MNYDHEMITLYSFTSKDCSHIIYYISNNHFQFLCAYEKKIIEKQAKIFNINFNIYFLIKTVFCLPNKHVISDSFDHHQSFLGKLHHWNSLDDTGQF